MPNKMTKMFLNLKMKFEIRMKALVSVALKQHWYISCYSSGYEGENCELDVDECETQPCENDAECFQRSDSRHYRVLPDLDTDFSYESAAGFLCRCLAGFTGQTRILQSGSSPYKDPRWCITIKMSLTAYDDCC